MAVSALMNDRSYDDVAGLRVVQIWKPKNDGSRRAVECQHDLVPLALESILGDHANDAQADQRAQHAPKRDPKRFGLPPQKCLALPLAKVFARRPLGAGIKLVERRKVRPQHLNDGYCCVLQRVLRRS